MLMKNSFGAVAKLSSQLNKSSQNTFVMLVQQKGSMQGRVVEFRKKLKRRREPPRLVLKEDLGVFDIPDKEIHQLSLQMSIRTLLYTTRSVPGVTGLGSRDLSLFYVLSVSRGSITGA